MLTWTTGGQASSRDVICVIEVIIDINCHATSRMFGSAMARPVFILLIISVGYSQSFYYQLLISQRRRDRTENGIYGQAPDVQQETTHRKLNTRLGRVID